MPKIFKEMIMKKQIIICDFCREEGISNYEYDHIDNKYYCEKCFIKSNFEKYLNLKKEIIFKRNQEDEKIERLRDLQDKKLNLEREKEDEELYNKIMEQ